MLQTLVEMLEDEFQIVGTAENGTRVLELAPRLAPDIVVLDISMPVLNGLEAAFRLKEQCSAARVVFLTAHEDPDLVEAGMSAGAIGYVVKSRLATDLVPARWREKPSSRPRSTTRNRPALRREAAQIAGGVGRSPCPPIRSNHGNICFRPLSISPWNSETAASPMRTGPDPRYPCQ